MTPVGFKGIKAMWQELELLEEYIWKSFTHYLPKVFTVTFKWSKAAIPMTIVCSLKSVVIVTTCISDHNDTNKRNNCLNSFCALNIYLNDEH